MKPNHFAAAKPTIILLELPEKEPQVATNADGEVLVFKNLKKAQKYVASNIEESLHKFINFANEKPEYGAGDREELNHRRCLRCKSFLRPSEREHLAKMPDGSSMAIAEYDCPVCDLGEDPQQKFH